MNLEKLISSFTEYEKKKILEIIIFSTNVVKDELPIAPAKGTLSDFLKDESIVLSVRLSNLLRKICSLDKIYPDLVKKNIHDIRKDDFTQFRNFGTNCWMEFEQAVSTYKPKPYIVKPKILLDDWLKDFQRGGERQMSMRLYGLLFLINRDDGIYIDQIEEKECYRRRNFGKKSWQEFVKLRGY
jgi:hypothetical protein